MFKSKFQHLNEFIFYGNYFYGLCVVGALFETVTQLKLNIKHSIFYGIAFIATVLFYNHPYARNYSFSSNNTRTIWYKKHHSFIVVNQLIFTVCLTIGFVWLSINYHREIKSTKALDWLLLFIFPLIGGLYYGVNVLSKSHNLRQIGWLKPFIIGFVWAGMSNVYPILFANLTNGNQYEWNLASTVLFLKSFLFISMLAILFDIKDYVVDSKEKLNTLMVKYGLRKTIFYVIIPLTLLGLLTLISDAFLHQFSIAKMLLLMIPFLCLLFATHLFNKRRKLLYYLIVIDGLILIKAFFGVLAYWN